MARVIQVSKYSDIKKFIDSKEFGVYQLTFDPPYKVTSCLSLVDKGLNYIKFDFNADPAGLPTESTFNSDFPNFIKVWNISAD